MLKELIEKRGAALKEMNEIIGAAREEKRSITAEETKRFDELDKEYSALGKTIEAEERAAELNAAEAHAPEEKRAYRDAVADIIRCTNGVENRAGEMTTTSTGRIVPSEFSKDIIRETVALSGILNMISIVNSKGDYQQIIADSANKITAGWTDEIGEITASEAKFSTIKIGHHKLASLVKMSLELINQNEFDIVSEVQNQMVQDFALKSETAVISGNGSDKPYGLTTGGTAYELPTAAVTADDLIKILHSLKAPYHNGAAWLMSNSTLCAIRLLKDGNGQYMFHQNDDLTSGFAGSVLGKPVLLSDAMDNLEAGKAPILFGNYARGYKANINPDMSMQVLNEKYAEYGMRGIVGILWLDGRPINNEAYVTVKVKAASGD